MNHLGIWSNLTEGTCRQAAPHRCAVAGHPHAAPCWPLVLSVLGPGRDLCSSVLLHDVLCGQSNKGKSLCSSEQSCCFLATGVIHFLCRLNMCSTTQHVFPSTSQNKGWKSLIPIYLLAVDELLMTDSCIGGLKKKKKGLQELGSGLCPVPALAPLLMAAALPAEVMAAVGSWGQCAAAPFFPFSQFPSCPDVAFWLLPLFWSKLSQQCQKHLWWGQILAQGVVCWGAVAGLHPAARTSHRGLLTEEVSPQPSCFQTLANSAQCNPGSCHLWWRIIAHPVGWWWR